MAPGPHESSYGRAHARLTAPMPLFSRRGDPMLDQIARDTFALFPNCHRCGQRVARFEDADVRVLEPRDALAAAMTVREQREGVAGDLVEHRVAAAAEQGHRGGQAGVGTAVGRLMGARRHEVRCGSAGGALCG